MATRKPPRELEPQPDVAAEETLFAPPEAPADLVARAKEAGWPGDLIPRAMRLRIPVFQIENWLAAGYPSPDRLDPWLGSREQVMFGTLRVRQSSWEDDQRVADLFANAPETVGEWQVTVEREPYPFAQLRLQENPFMQVLEDRGVILGAYASSGRNALVGGQEISVGVTTSWRIREGFRGRGYSDLVRNTPGPSTAQFPMLTYWYVRQENAGARSWVSGLTEQWRDGPDEWSADVAGLTATVFHVHGEGTSDPRVRETGRADLEPCVTLVNRAHDGLDLFRPYTAEFLQRRLDDPFWGPKPPFWTPVYAFGDHFVLEEDGRILACAGLWDQGRNQRERWSNPQTGESRVVDHTSLLDFGCAEGREDALADLIAHLAERSSSIGRTTLVAPLEFLPAVRERLRGVRLEPESRSLQSMPFTMPGVKVDAQIERPYTDLVYW